MLCIMRLLKNGAMDMAKLMLCMVLAVDDRLNSKIRYAYKIENIYTELCQDSLLNRKFISYGPYFMKKQTCYRAADSIFPASVP